MLPLNVSCILAKVDGVGNAIIMLSVRCSLDMSSFSPWLGESKM